LTRYLIGRPVVAEPYLELYEGQSTGTGPATRLGFQPGIAGPVNKLKFSQKLTELALECDYRRATVPGIGNPNTPIATGGIKVFSPEDNYVVLGGNASTLAAMYYRRGPYYLPVPPDKVPFPVTSGAYVTAAVMSNQAGVLAFITSDAPTLVKFCDKVTDAETGLDTWTQKATATIATGLTGLSIAPDGSYISVSAPGIVGHVYKLVGTVYVDVSRSGANPIQGMVKRSDGAIYVIEKSLTAATAAVVYKYDGTTWTLVITLLINTANGGVSSGYKFSPDGNTIVYCYTRTATGTGDVLSVYHHNGTTFVKMASTPVTTPRWPTTTTCIVSPDGMFAAVSFFSIGASPQNPTVRMYALTTAGTTTTMTLVHEWVTTASSIIARNFSPDMSVIHCSNGNSIGQHFSTVTPFGELTSIPEAPGVAASTVWEVDYGTVGQASFAISGSTVIPVIRDGKGSYLDARILEGTFVFLYDRKPSGSGGADNFIERNFVQHLLGTVVTDIVFSPDSKVLLYHTTRPGVTDQSGLGRFVYDISRAGFITYKGAIYLASDEASFAAVNPSSSYFVVCFRNPTNGSNVKLYKLDALFAYTEKDSHLVDYGPVAFSVCETVVVAHGGLTPYTLYAHTSSPDVLVLQPITFTDWDSGSDILAAAFTPDCDGVVLLTPDEIVLLDSDDGSEDDSSDQQNPPDSTIDMDPDSPNSMIVIPRDNGAAGGSAPANGAGTGIDVPSKSVDKFEYIPYVAINITYRTW
jgi:hypothetical protein